jgi:hypothetical protein
VQSKKEETAMVVERYSAEGGGPSGTSLIDVLDRVLDKGIVIDAWVRVSLVGIDLVTVEARIVVASIDTYLRYAEAIGITAPSSRSIGAPIGRTPLAEPGDGVQQVQERMQAPRTRSDRTR